MTRLHLSFEPWKGRYFPAAVDLPISDPFFIVTRQRELAIPRERNTRNVLRMTSKLSRLLQMAISGDIENDNLSGRTSGQERRSVRTECTTLDHSQGLKSSLRSRLRRIGNIEQLNS